MKVRSDYVTNSSSSSYICIAKIDLCDELKMYMKEEFGNHALSLLNKYLVPGEKILAGTDQIYDDLDFWDISVDTVSTDAYYLRATFITYSDEGRQNGYDAFLYQIIPDKYKHEILHTEDD